MAVACNPSFVVQGRAAAEASASGLAFAFALVPAASAEPSGRRMGWWVAVEQAACRNSAVLAPVFVREKETGFLWVIA